MQTDEKIVGMCEETPEQLTENEEALVEEPLEMEVLRAALAESKRTITVAWVQRKFHYGYTKSSVLLKFLAQKGYVESEEDMKNAGHKARRILVPKDFFEKKN